MKTPKNPDSDPRRARGRPREGGSAAEQNIIKSLDRAIEVFDYLSSLQGASLTGLASDLDQSPATVYRILVTLEARGLVEFDPAMQLWHVGPQAFVIGARFLRRSSLAERARPLLRRLMMETGETANLGIAQGQSVLFVSQVETQSSIRAFFPPGTTSPLHASGIGKALLAHMEESQVTLTLSSGKLERFTEFTICDPAQLGQELQNIRACGFAFDNEEKNIGMRCIAAPVFGPHGEAVAGLSVSGPTSRITHENVEPFAKAVVDAAKELSRSIGGEPVQQPS
ncbi:IclR family transcriptional regulator [Ruegeria sediminis]|uniref:IclR family transcriptional regulator n=1 Tax=Ruegeria sediminis TaxID=2583820 RepID=A0ABY2WU02_9RHOB|nr:HTH-type transcriptional regulator BhcR [Ruegeria sediminis]TMV05496.1 IclR family transcriptional regulator [Ruegeria sediminis]